MSITTYHVFSDLEDHFTDDLEEALAIAQRIIEANEETPNLRLYKEVAEDENDDNPKEDCLLSIGLFPA